jgi:ATPase subunit of ABC transporter with duplicated ATPase domains
MRPVCFFCAGYLRQQDIPLVIVSHDREFLDQLCTKIVETEHGIATTYKVKIP